MTTTFGQLPIGARFVMADSPMGHVKIKTGYDRWKWEGYDGFLPVAIGCPADREVIACGVAGGSGVGMGTGFTTKS